MHKCKGTANRALKYNNLSNSPNLNIALIPFPTTSPHNPEVYRSENDGEVF
jgi:hypothetical protein